MPSRNRKKRSKQRAEYLQKQDDILSQQNKAKARARYKADPEKKKASVRNSYKADPEKKKASVRDSYKADPEKKKAFVCDSYKADPEKKASVRDSYKADPEKKKASVRDSYKADPEKNPAKNSYGSIVVMICDYRLNSKKFVHDDCTCFVRFTQASYKRRGFNKSRLYGYLIIITLSYNIVVFNILIVLISVGSRS
ncbi:hypothetical protein EMCRGX_G026077 [Ephydatia muelleri]